MKTPVRLRRDGPFRWTAVREGKELGLALCGPDGEIRELSVLPQHRRHGIGRCLVRAVISDLLRAGVGSMRMTASEDSGKAFCESLGGRDLGGGAYGWTDLKTVAKCAEKSS